MRGRKVPACPDCGNMLAIPDDVPEARGVVSLFIPGIGKQYLCMPCGGVVWWQFREQQIQRTEQGLNELLEMFGPDRVREARERDASGRATLAADTSGLVMPPHAMPVIKAAALESWAEGDDEGACSIFGNEWTMWMVQENLDMLRERDSLEVVLADAISSHRVNNRRWFDTIRWLLSLCDRDRLLATGDPLPGAGPFTLYRGVAGVGVARRVRGFSWTACPRVARWFARRFQLQGPAIFVAEVPAADVYVRLHAAGRTEDEYIIRPPSRSPRRVSAPEVDAMPCAGSADCMCQTRDLGGPA